MIYGAETILLVLTVLEAWWHSWLIKANRPILHGAWAAAVGVLIVGAAWLLRDQLRPAYRMPLFMAACTAGHLIVFNIALNRFRGLSWTYVSKTSTSLIDQAELRLFGSRVWVLEAMMGALFLTLQFFI